MRTVLLSDHPGDLLARSAGKRDQRVRSREKVLHSAVRERDKARAERRWLTWLRLAFRARRERKSLSLVASPRIPDDREEAIRAGRDAELRVAADLERALDGDWVLLRGYRNRRGEIDGLLLGPGGLFAYEVKYLNGTVHISGDRWLAEKFDKYGNLVQPRAPLLDRGGRSPSRQLREPADALRACLGQCGQRVTITPVILLVHERSRIGSLRKPTVRVVTSVGDLVRLVSGSAAPAGPRLGAGRRAAIEKIIRDDHRRCERGPRQHRPSGQRAPRRAGRR